MNTHRHTSPMRGFTVIELLVVIVIVGILAMIAVPSFNDLVIGTRVKNAASDIYAALVLARSEAIKRGANVDVAPVGGAWTGGWQVSVSGGGTVLSTQDAVKNLRIECPSGTSCTQTVTYRRDGRLTAGTATFFVDVQTVPSPRRVPPRCVVVGVSGQINVQVDNNKDGDCSNG